MAGRMKGNFTLSASIIFEKSRREMNDVSTIEHLKPFDFKSLRGFSLRVKRRLEEVHSRFSQNLIRMLRNSGLEKIEMSFDSIQRIKAKNYAAREVESSFNFFFELERDQRGGLVIEPEVVDKLLSSLLGYRVEKKESGEKLTRIEHNILIQFVRALLKELESSWGGELKIGSLDLESGREFLQKTELILSEFSVKAEKSSGGLEIIYPFSVIDKFSYKNLNPILKDKEKVKELLENSEVKFTCILGDGERCGNKSQQLTLTQISDLKSGDIILMEELNPECKLLVDDKYKFRGIPGVFKGKKGVKITSVIF